MSRLGLNIYHRKDGRWEGRYIKGRRPNGKPIFGSVYDLSRKKVQQKLLPLKAAYCEKSMETKCTMPFRDYLLPSLAKKRSGRIKSSTYDSYYRIVHNHILPALGNTPMHRLSSQQVEDFLKDLQNSGLADGTIHNIFRYLGSVVRNAVKTGAMAQDVCEGISLAKPKQKVVDALSREEQQRLERAALSAMRKNDMGNGFEVMLALNTGMRIGEICALRWEDIDFGRNVINVRHTLQRLNTYGKDPKTLVVIGKPKSDCSERPIPINAQLLRLLQEQYSRTRGEFVVPGHRNFNEPRVLQYRFERLLKSAQIPRVGFHATRHSFATRCMELDVRIETISKLLGHSSVKQTSDIYVHSLLEQRFMAVHRLDQLATA